MKRSKNIIPPPIKKMIFNSLIQSHLNYAIVIWGSAKGKLLDPLEKAQKRAIRIVNNQHYIKHTDPLFASHDCLKIKDMYKLNMHLLKCTKSSYEKVSFCLQMCNSKCG